MPNRPGSVASGEGRAVPQLHRPPQLTCFIEGAESLEAFLPDFTRLPEDFHDSWRLLQECVEKVLLQ